MKSRQQFLTFGLLSSIVVVVAVLFSQGLIPLPLAEGAHGGLHELSGYAWSSNIGWISLKGVTGSNDEYGVKSVLRNGSVFEGYAWSSNIGWISFYDNTGIPPSGGAAGVSLSSGNNLVGWARACSVFKNNEQANRCQGELLSPEERGGWDGWISMNCSNTNSCAASDYKVSYNSNTSQLTDFAWGADVVGWIDFCSYASDPSLGPNACVTVDTLSVGCTVDDSTPSINQGITYTATATGGTGSFTYVWTYPADFTPTGPVNGFQLTGSYPGFGSKAVSVIVSDSNGQGSASCPTVLVEDQSNPILTVNVNSGGGSGKVTADFPGTNNVPANWAGAGGTGCLVNLNQLSTCLATYQLNDPVALKAVPDNILGSDPPANYNYTWTDCRGTLAGDTCNVIMDDSKPSSVTFWDPNSAAVVLTADRNLIWISFHAEGQSAFSNEAKITAQNRDARLCVASFVSITGDSIDTVTGPQDRVKCILGSGPPGSCTSGNTCLNISQNEPVAFSVEVPTKLIELVRNNPYQIILRADGRPDSQIPIRFEYRVRDIRP